MQAGSFPTEAHSVSMDAATWSALLAATDAGPAGEGMIAGADAASSEATVAIYGGNGKRRS